METIEILRRARARIADPKRWTINTTARDADGEPVSSCDDEAVRWCAIGAIDCVAPSCAYEREDARSTLQQSCVRMYGITSVSVVNDRHGHDNIIAAFDHAIAKLEAGEKT